MTRKNAGVVLAIVMVVGLVMMCLTSCGVETKITDERLETPEMEIEEPESDPEETSIAVMSWILGYETSWTETVRDGFELGFAVRIWEPMQTSDAEHPGNGEPMSVPEGYDGAKAWVVPFEITATNETVGFGALPANFLIGSTYGGGSGLREEDNAGGTLLLKTQNDVSAEARERAEARARDQGLARVMCMMTSDASVTQDAFSFITEIGEGKSMTQCGYLVFIDAKRTPNIPNGVDADWFEKTIVIIAAGPEYGMGNYACQRLVRLTKVGDGNLVFGKEYEVYAPDSDGADNSEEAEVGQEMYVVDGGTNKTELAKLWGEGENAVRALDEFFSAAWNGNFSGDRMLYDTKTMDYVRSQMVTLGEMYDATKDADYLSFGTEEENADLRALREAIAIRYDKYNVYMRNFEEFSEAFPKTEEEIAIVVAGTYTPSAKAKEMVDSGSVMRGRAAESTIAYFEWARDGAVESEYPEYDSANYLGVFFTEDPELPEPPADRLGSLAFRWGYEE